MKEELIYFDQIEAFHNGTVSAETQASFEAELNTNVALKKEYDAYLASQKVLQALGMDMLKTHPLPIEESAKRTKVFPFWRVAAALFLLSGTLLWYANQFYSNASLIRYQAPKNQVVRGDSETSTSTINQAVNAYEKADFQEVVNLLSSIDIQNTFYNESQFLLGHSYYQLKYYGKSAAAFKHVLMSEDTRFFENALWNSANIYLLVGAQKQASVILKGIANDKNNSYQKEAKRTLQKLHSNWRYLTFL